MRISGFLNSAIQSNYSTPLYGITTHVSRAESRRSQSRGLRQLYLKAYTAIFGGVRDTCVVCRDTTGAEQLLKTSYIEQNRG
jgi:hypothetical protein